MADALQFQGGDGEAYERQMGRWSQRLSSPFLEFVGDGDGTHVLDVGCGTGSLTFELAKENGGGKYPQSI